MLRPSLCLPALVLRHLRSAPTGRGLPVERNCISLAPARLDRYPCGFTGHVADPISSIEIRSSPNSLIATLATLPSTR
jgi:hypothetical protein